MERLDPFINVTMHERCILIKDTCYIDATGLNFNVFYDEMEEWTVLNTEPIRSTDKVLYNMRHSETGQVRFIIKSHPGSRNTSLIGVRSRRDILQTT